MTAQLDLAPQAARDREGAVLCPVAIARTCGLPISVLSALAAPELLRTYDALRVDTELLATLGPGLADRLTSVVPLLPPAARRAVLALRRGAHSGRPVGFRGAVPAELAEVATVDLMAAAQRYLELSRRLADRVEAVRQAAGPDLGVDLDRLASVLSTPAIRRSLALASPDFARTLGRHLPSTGSARRRWLRSAVGYLVRCALKPSPFGSLTTVAAVQVAGGSGQPMPTGDPAVVTGTLPLAVELLLAIAGMDAKADQHPDALLLRANASLRPGDELPTMLVPVRLCTDGFFFRDENRIQPVGVPAALLASADQPPAGHREWRRRLGISAAAVGRLVGAGVLQPVLPFDPATTRPLTALADALPGAPGLDALAEHEQALGDLDPARRAEALGALRTATASSLAAVRRRPPGWLATAPLAHDVVGTPAIADAPQAPMVADLQRFAEALGKDTVRTVFYDQLVAAFVAGYGRDGVCTDLLDFCYRVVGGDRWIRQLMAARQADRTTPVLAPPVGNGTLASATACVLAQSAIDAEGRELTVINRMNTGPGALLARWAVRPEIGTALAAHTSWVRDLHPGCRVLSVSAGEDWAPVQRQAAGGLGRLRWPTSLRADRALQAGGALQADNVAADLALDELGLRLDPAGDTLQVFEQRTGTGVAFAYLGVIPRHLITGPLRVLMTLSDPWVIRTRVGGDVPSEDDDALGAAAPARRVDRRMLAGVVVERQTWSLPVGGLPQLAGLDDPVDLLQQLQTWWQAMDLPPRVFVTGESANGARVGKPAWMSLDHPITAWAGLRTLDERVARVSITESLPDLLDSSRRPAGTTAGAGEHAVEWAFALRLDGGS